MEQTHIKRDGYIGEAFARYSELPLPYDFGSGAKQQTGRLAKAYRKIYRLMKNKGWYDHDDVRSIGCPVTYAAAIAQGLRRKGCHIIYNQGKKRWELVDDHRMIAKNRTP